MSNEIISEDLARFLIGVCDDYGLNWDNDYSGRGMFGNRCFSIRTDESVGRLFAGIIFAFNEETLCYTDEIGRMFEDMRQDSMGLGRVYYFPGWTIPESVMEELEDEGYFED